MTSGEPPANTPAPPVTAHGPGPRSGHCRHSRGAEQVPVPSTPASIAAGKTRLPDHLRRLPRQRGPGGGEGRGVSISIIEEQGGRQPSDLTDSEWDHGASDGEIFAVDEARRPVDHDAGVRRAPIRSTDMWNIVNYLRNLASRK